MKIKKLKLRTHLLQEEQIFYTQTLGFPLIQESHNSFTVKVGWSELTFEKATEKHPYHYCFMIPANLLDAALEWMHLKHEVIKIEKGQYTQEFESWNATSFYFYDASGNIAEIIVRYDLENHSNTDDFQIDEVLCVNEIGMPNTQIEKLSAELNQQSNSPFWKGDKKRFGTNGTQDGLFLLPNYQEKEIWFPTDIVIGPTPFEIQFESEGVAYSFEYKEESIIWR